MSATPSIASFRRRSARRRRRCAPARSSRTPASRSARVCGATGPTSAAMRSGSQVEAHSTVLRRARRQRRQHRVRHHVLDLVGVEHREQDHIAARDLVERRRDSARLRERRGLRGIDVVALRIESPRRSAGAPVRCRAGRAPRCRSCAPWSCAGDLVEDREQRLRIGDVRIVARVDLVGLPALALRALIELAEVVADAGLLA